MPPVTFTALDSNLPNPNWSVGDWQSCFCIPVDSDYAWLHKHTCLGLSCDCLNMKNESLETPYGW